MGITSKQFQGFIRLALGWLILVSHSGKKPLKDSCFKSSFKGFF